MYRGHVAYAPYGNLMLIRAGGILCRPEGSVTCNRNMGLILKTVESGNYSRVTADVVLD